MRKKLLLFALAISLFGGSIYATTSRQDTQKTDTTKTEKSKKHKVWECYIEQNPTFPGDIQRFIKKHLRYPKTEDCVQGRVVVKFFIDPKGRCSRFEVVRSIAPLFDKEAIRVLKKMPKWKWGSKPKHGMWYTMPVRFRLQ